MILKSIIIKNFKSIKDVELNFDSLTALVGANGTGKSSFLQAIDLFYSGTPIFSAGDFYNGNTANDIEIALTFTDLRAEAKLIFESYIEGNDLTVLRVLSLTSEKSSTTYHGYNLQNPDFSKIRLADSAKEKRICYDNLKNLLDYKELPRWTNQAEVETNLKQWEHDNPGLCSRQRDDGQFFGFKGVAQGYLGRFTRFIMIPAVRDAENDASDTKGSVITSLMDLVVRSVLATRKDLISLKEETQKRFDEILNPNKLEELSGLAESLTSTLQTYVPNSNVSLSWIDLGGIDLPIPKAEVKLIEDGYSTSVGRTGHGLQRAFVMTMLQHLALAHSKPDQNTNDANKETINGKRNDIEIIVGPDLILAIEEPELYQHPIRQRHFSRVLLELATGTIQGVAVKTQIIYCTHSPLFLGVDRLDHIRLLRKHIAEPEEPKITRVISTNLDETANIIWHAKGNPIEKFTGQSLKPRLQAIMTPWMNEGFFADVVVLVEGEDDRAAILGVADAMNKNLEKEGISIVPCMGKNNIDRPLVIFKNLGIPVYTIWDGDYGGKDAKPETNRYILRLLVKPEVDWPKAVEADYACFEGNLEKTLREEIGPEDFDRIVKDIIDEFGFQKKEEALKIPFIFQRIIQDSIEVGKKSPTLEAMVIQIWNMKKLGSPTVEPIR